MQDLFGSWFGAFGSWFVDLIAFGVVANKTWWDCILEAKKQRQKEQK